MSKLIGYTFVVYDPDVYYERIDYEWLKFYLDNPINVYKTLVETYTGILKHNLKEKNTSIDDLCWVENFYKDLIKKEGTSWEGLWEVMEYLDSGVKTSIKCVFVEEPIPEKLKVAYTFAFEDGDKDNLEADFNSEITIYPTLRSAYNGCMKYIRDNIAWLENEKPDLIEFLDVEIESREGTIFKKNFSIGSFQEGTFKLYLKCVCME